MGNVGYAGSRGIAQNVVELLLRKVCHLCLNLHIGRANVLTNIMSGKDTRRADLSDGFYSILQPFLWIQISKSSEIFTLQLFLWIQISKSSKSASSDTLSTHTSTCIGFTILQHIFHPQLESLDSSFPQSFKADQRLKQH